jgi:hypothetical protein
LPGGREVNKKAYSLSAVNLVKYFFVLLENYSDHPRNLFIFMSFFKIVLRNKAIDEMIPVVELMTVLKYERPTIFHHMRKQTEDWIYVLTRIEMEVQEAREKLYCITNSY